MKEVLRPKSLRTATLSDALVTLVSKYSFRNCENYIWVIVGPEITKIIATKNIVHVAGASA